MKGRLVLVNYSPDISKRANKPKAESRQEQKQKTSYLKTAVIQLTFVKRSYISLMALNDFSLVSSSDSEASETENYKLLYNLKAYQN